VSRCISKKPFNVRLSRSVPLSPWYTDGTLPIHFLFSRKLRAHGSTLLLRMLPAIRRDLVRCSVSLKRGRKLSGLRRAQAISSVTRIIATALLTLDDCSLVFLLQVQTKFFFAVNVLPSCSI
jgi:hypothetical protein